MLRSDSGTAELNLQCTNGRSCTFLWERAIHEQKCCGGQQIDGILATPRVLEMSASCLVFRLLLSCLPWLDLFVRLAGGFLARQHLGLDSEGFLGYFHGHGVAIINLLYLTIN